jgi:hypothetical protein
MARDAIRGWLLEKDVRAGNCRQQRVAHPSDWVCVRHLEPFLGLAAGQRKVR